MFEDVKLLINDSINYIYQKEKKTGRHSVKQIN